jgi:hypothetical protein
VNLPGGGGGGEDGGGARSLAMSLGGVRVYRQSQQFLEASGNLMTSTDAGPGGQGGGLGGQGGQGGQQGVRHKSTSMAIEGRVSMQLRPATIRCGAMRVWCVCVVCAVWAIMRVWCVCAVCV